MPELIESINHRDYNKISDDLFIIGRNMLLKFNVGLIHMENESLTGYHKEIAYLRNSTPVVNIKRNFDFFFSLENMKEVDGIQKEFVRIGVVEQWALAQLLQSAMDWFRTEQYKDLFARKDNKLVITRRLEPLRIDNLPQGKFIEVEPCIIIFDDIQETPGVRFYLNDRINFCEMTFDRLLGFHSIIANTPMYPTACLLVNYLQRPDYGTNLMEFTNAGLVVHEQEKTVLVRPIKSPTNNRFHNMRGE